MIELGLLHVILERWDLTEQHFASSSSIEIWTFPDNQNTSPEAQVPVFVE
jgi:hypothetical protein